MLLLDEQFLNILMERTRQLKSDIESGPVTDEIGKQRWDAMDSELVRMKPIYLNYHVGAGNSQFRFQSHRARFILNKSLDIADFNGLQIPLCLRENVSSSVATRSRVCFGGCGGERAL